MHADLVTSAGHRHCLRKLLLGYLGEIDVGNWPGVDGQTLDDVLLSYHRYATRGLVPDRLELLRRHPHLSEEVTALFSKHDQAEE